MPFVVNLALSSFVISVCVALAEKRPALGGFILSLPISTLIALALTQFRYADTEKTVVLARSILVSLPMTLVFFIPFVLPERMRPPFWICYGVGISLLGVAYLAHRAIFRA